MSGLHDAVFGLVLIGIIALPIVWLAPQFIHSAVDLARGLFTSLFYLTIALVILVLGLGTALIAEKAVRRWKREGQNTPTSSSSGRVRGTETQIKEERDRFGVVPPDAPDYEKRRARRVARESRFEEAAEVIVDRLEQSSVGKLLKRKVRGPPSSSDRRPGAADEVVVLSDMSKTAATTAVRRMPPPPPPLPAR
ncbi:hypothetical protein JCM11251_004908 [Rhodosporidiobolus azoricus]